MVGCALVTSVRRALTVLKGSVTKHRTAHTALLVDSGSENLLE